MLKAGRKRVSVSIDTKKAIIRYSEDHPTATQEHIAGRFGVKRTTVCMILLDKGKWINAPQGTDSKKKFRLPKYQGIEEALLQWIGVQRNQGISVNGVDIMDKAKVFATALAPNDFRASPGWLHQFKKRNGLSFDKKITTDDGVNMDSVQNARRSLMETVSGYRLEDVYNIDVSGSFYNCLPDRNLPPAESRDSLSFLLGSNATGEDRLPLLITGRAKQLRPAPDGLLACYAHTENGLMNSEVMEEWIQDLDNRMKGRKILVILDNAEYNAGLRNIPFDNVQLHFISCPMAGFLQPMDLGIIAALKKAYKTEFVQRCLTNISDRTANPGKISLSEAVTLLSRAWEDVDSHAILSAWSRCGIVAKEAQNFPRGHILDSVDQMTKLNELIRLLPFANAMTASEFVELDKDFDIETSAGDSLVDSILNETVPNKLESVKQASSAAFPAPDLSVGMSCRVWSTTEAIYGMHKLVEYFKVNQCATGLARQLEKVLLDIDKTFRQSLERCPK